MCIRAYQLSLVATIFLASWAAYSFVIDGIIGDSNRNVAQVREFALDIGAKPHRQRITVDIRVQNPSDRILRILAVEEVCWEGRCCFGSTHVEPVIVPPHGENSYPVFMTVFAEGHFEAPVVLLVDDGNLRKLTITVKGEGIAGSPSNGEKSP